MRIVETASLASADSTDWSVDTTAMVSIGVFEGADPYVFGDIAGATRDGQGRIIIADRQANEVRFFSGTGQFLHKMGRSGGGPGEYTYFRTLLQRPPDSIAVIDHEGGRINILDQNGNYVRSFRPHGQANRLPAIEGYFSDGSMLAVHGQTRCNDVPLNGGFCVDSAQFQRVAEDGTLLAEYGFLPLTRHHYVSMGKGWSAYLSNRYPQAYVAIFRDRFYYSDGALLEVRVFAPGGALERIMRVRHEPPAPKPEMFSVPMTANIGFAGQRPDSVDHNAMYRAASSSVPLPKRLPAHSGLIVDRVGNIWLREFTPYPNVNRSRWLVLDSTGVLRHQLVLPVRVVQDRFERWGGDIGDYYVLGSYRDANRLESVRLLPLHKAQSQ